MASKKEELNEPEDARCPPIKKNLIEPKSFNIRQFANVGQSAKKMTFRERDAAGMNNTNQLIDSAHGFTSKEEIVDSNSLEKDKLKLDTEGKPTRNNLIPTKYSPSNGKVQISDSKDNVYSKANDGEEMVIDKYKLDYHGKRKAIMSDSNTDTKDKCKALDDVVREGVLSISNDDTKEEFNVERTKMIDVLNADTDEKHNFVDYDESKEILSASLLGHSKDENMGTTNCILTPIYNLNRCSMDSSRMRDVASPWIQITLDEPDAYVWKFAFSNKTVSKHIINTFHECDYDVEFRECLFVRCRKGKVELDMLEIKHLMSEGIQDLHYKVYTLGKELSDDVLDNVNHLIKRPKTRMKPENPFRDNIAAVYFTEPQITGYCHVVLVAMKMCFLTCTMEIEDIINGCFNTPDVLENTTSTIHMPIMNKLPSKNRKQEVSKRLFVNCEEWKFRWIITTEGNVDMIEKKFHVRLTFNKGILCIISESESEVDFFRNYFQKKTKTLGKETKFIQKDMYKLLQSNISLIEQVHQLEKKYGVMVDICKAIDHQEDIQIEMNNVSVILTTKLKIEQALLVNIISSSHGFRFRIADETVPHSSLKHIVQELLQRCSDGVLAVQVDIRTGKFNELTSTLLDFIECLRGCVNNSSEFTILIMTNSAKLFLHLNRRLEGFRQPLLACSPELGGPIDIQVIQGTLAEQKVGVIVNSSNESLTLTQGAVSKSLLNVSGLEMQTEAKQKYPDGIKGGQIASTKAYGLQASHVFHTCLFGWNVHVKEKQDACRKILQNVVRECLGCTEKLALKSIAFPALGTGVLKFPDAVVAEDMIKTALQYSRENPNTCIQEVLFVIYVTEKQLFKAFMDKLDEHMKQGAELEISDDDMEYCAVITGNKEDVSVAKARFSDELLSKYQSEISGHSQKIEILSKRQSDIQRLAIEGATNPICRSFQDKIIHIKDKATLITKTNDDITVQHVRKGLTSEKGAIPKTKEATTELSDDSERRWTHEEKTKRIERLHVELPAKPFEDDLSVDELLDEYLEDVTVTLCKKQSKNLLDNDFKYFCKRLKRECNVCLDVRGGILKGTAKDIARASLRIVNANENHDSPSDLSGRESIGEETGSSEGFQSDEDAFDNALVQDIFERTLSIKNKTDETFKLRNIRKEVFMLFKIIYKDKWQNLSKYCKETCIDEMVNLTIGGKLENFSSVKSTLDELDSFQFIELDSKIPFKQLLEKANSIKERGEKFGEVYVIEGGDTVILAGRTYDIVDELKRIIENTIKRGNQTPTSQRKLGRHLSGLDETEYDTYENFSEHKPQHENVDERESKRERFDPGDIEGCMKFTTNECIKIYVYKSSILRLKVDCIVNAANSQLEHGGGIAKMIADAAGPRLVTECKDYINSFGRLPVGTCCVTSAGLLPFKHVIHTVGPCLSDYRKDEMLKVNQDLYDAIYSSLTELKGLRCRSIGIPSVSTGIFGVPKKLCALQYCLAVEDFSQSQYESSVKEVHFIDVDEEMIQIIGLTFDIVLNNNDSSKDALKLIFPKQKTTTKAIVRKFLHLQKNKRRVEQPTNYPFVRYSLHSKLKIELSKGFQVSVRQGNIVDFKKGVVVCGQDPELKCQSGVARSILKVDRKFDGNLRRRHNKKWYNAGEVLEFRSKSIGCDIYNVILPRGEVGFSIVNFCYSQVLEMASQKSVPAIALPLLITGDKGQVRQLGRMLAGLFIELVNAKGPHHLFPSVYVYTTDKHNAKLISEAFTEIMLPPKADEDPKSQPSPGRWQRRSKFRTFPRKKSRSNESLDSDIFGRYALDDGVNSSCKEKIDALPSENVYLQLSKVEQINERNQDRRTLLKDDEYDINIDNESMTLEERAGASLESMKCVICMDSLNKPKILQKCGHTFCSECIDEYFKVKPVCPTCFTPYGILTGTQPKGEMKYYNDRSMSLPGYRMCGLIKIQYSFPDGVQGEEHPNPGKPYTGTRRTAYLPDNEHGRKVCKMLEVAFNRKLVFTIGRSVTTGAENIVTWNDIHHKTNINGGPANYGYPDPDYLSRVTEELATKGVTEADIRL